MRVTGLFNTANNYDHTIALHLYAKIVSLLSLKLDSAIYDPTSNVSSTTSAVQLTII
jgi:hypothetical protein